MNGPTYNIKKISIIGGSIFLVIIIPLIIAVANSGFKIEKIHHVKSYMPLLMICFNKAVKIEGSILESKNFTTKSQPAYDDKCAAFQLSTPTSSSLVAGNYYMLLSIESESGQKVTDEEIIVQIVDGDSGETLSNDDLNRLVQANNSVDVNKSITYWKEQPIYKFVEPSSLAYKGGVWTIALRSDSELNPIIIVYIAMSTPPKNSPILNHISDQYKTESLNKIREWGVDPNQYTIEYKFDD